MSSEKNSAYIQEEIAIILDYSLFKKESNLKAIFNGTHTLVERKSKTKDVSIQPQDKIINIKEFLITHYKETSSVILKYSKGIDIKKLQKFIDETKSNMNKIDVKNNEEKNNNLGLIFHWGLYSVPGYDNVKSAIYRKIQNGSEWYQKRLEAVGTSFRPLSLGDKSTQTYHKINFGDVKTYQEFQKYFYPYDNSKNVFEDWCKIAKQLKAKYMILTAKHHDGYCLWNTKTTDYKYSKSDLLLQFKKTVKKNGFKFGIYFSLMEFNKPVNKEFIVNILAPQLIELSKYKPDYLWLDGNWEIKTQIAIKTITKIIESEFKNVIINDRICKDESVNKKLSSYRVFADRYIPKEKLHEEWQHINTIGLSWGYNRDQSRSESLDHYKTGQQLYDLYTEVVDKGGELLLNFGPKADGSLDENEVKSALEFSKLLSKKL